MTDHRDLKRLVRDRKAKTGEFYTAARAHVLRERAALLATDSPPEASTRAEAVVLKVNQQSARIRLLADHDQITFRSRDACDIVPGQVVTLVIEKRWTWRGDAYASGSIDGARIDVPRLRLEPLPLDGGELDDMRSSSEPYRRPNPYAPLWRRLTAKARPSFEFDGVAWGKLPGVDEDENPTCDAIELAEAGDAEGARELLMDVLCEDLRCIDAHAGLGNVEFERSPRRAIVHYENRDPHRGTVAPRGLRRAAPVGAPVQPPVLALPARLRPMPLALGAARPGGGRLRAHPVAQSERQPGRAVLLVRRSPGAELVRDERARDLDERRRAAGPSLTSGFSSGELSGIRLTNDSTS